MPEASGGRIVLIEDDDELRDALMAALDDLGYSIIPAEDSVAALREIRELGAPDLVLVDFSASGMSAYDMGAELSRDPDLAEIPIVVLVDDPEGLARAGALPNVTWMAKPPRFMELVSVLREQGISPPEPF